MLRKFFPTLLLILGMLLQTSSVPILAMYLEPGGLFPTFIPTGTATIFPLTQVDLDGNGTPEILSLNGNRLSILSGGETVWKSPEAWQIVQAAFSDLNRDGKSEVALLLWRPFHPWPVDRWLPNGGRIAEFHNTEGQSCHIILIGWTRGGIHELWAGSAMADPITSFAVADLNGDNLQELVALEGRYTDPMPRPEAPSRSAPARTLKVWEWNGFGFTVVSSIDGTFSKMILVMAKYGHILILVP